MVALLLARGADPRTVSNVFFQIAASCGRLQSIALVLDAGMPLDTVAPIVLEEAARAGHTDLIDLMEQRGAEPAMVARWRLLVAAKTGDDMKVQALLEAGVSADAVEEALLAALQCSHEGIVSRLFLHQGTGDTLLSEARKAILARACLCDSSSVLQRLAHHFCTHHPLLADRILMFSLSVSHYVVFDTFVGSLVPHVSQQALNQALCAEVAAGHSDGVQVLLKYGADATVVPESALSSHGYTYRRTIQLVRLAQSKAISESIAGTATSGAPAPASGDVQ